MSLAEKIALYTEGGKSPGVSEIIELRDIARKEGISNHDLEKRIQESIDQTKKSVNQENEHNFSPETNSSLFEERLSFEDEIKKREEKAESDIQVEYSEAVENITSDFDPSFNTDDYKIDEQINTSDFEKIEIPEKSIEIDYEKFQTETQEFLETKEKEEEIIIDDEIAPPPEVENIVQVDRVEYTPPPEHKKKSEKTTGDVNLKEEKSNFLLEKEAEWQSMHGKQNTYSKKKNTSNSAQKSSSSTKSNASKVSEAQKVFNISILAIFVSAFFGIIGTFVAFFAYIRLAAEKKKLGSNNQDFESMKKLDQSKWIIVAAIIVGSFRFIFGYMLMRL